MRAPWIDDRRPALAASAGASGGGSPSGAPACAPRSAPPHRAACCWRAIPTRSSSGRRISAAGPASISPSAAAPRPIAPAISRAFRVPVRCAAAVLIIGTNDIQRWRHPERARSVGPVRGRGPAHPADPGGMVGAGLRRARSRRSAPGRRAGIRAPWRPSRIASRRSAPSGAADTSTRSLRGATAPGGSPARGSTRDGVHLADYTPPGRGDRPAGRRSDAAARSAAAPPPGAPDPLRRRPAGAPRGLDRPPVRIRAPWPARPVRRPRAAPAPVGALARRTRRSGSTRTAPGAPGRRGTPWRPWRPWAPAAGTPPGAAGARHDRDRAGQRPGAARRGRPRSGSSSASRPTGTARRAF